MEYSKGLVALILLTAATLALILISGCGPRTPPARQGDAVAPLAEASFVGDEACASCHLKEFRSHSATRHGHTLRRIDRKSLGPLAPKTGRIENTGYVILSDGDRYAIGAAKYPKKVAELSLALGSGKTGMTYVSLMGSRLAEIEMTYFPEMKRWYRTPGHQKKPEYVLGQLYEGAFPRQCIGCHAVTLPTESLLPEERFFGVGCESCHGPGSRHIAAAKVKGATDLKIEDLTKRGGADLNNLCAKCHVPPEMGGTGSAAAASSDETHRFPPLGIMRSACFVKSGGKLSCVTCHDPHTNVSTDNRHYEAVCLSCHAPAATPIAQTENRVRGAACPVNPKSGCIPCHMPPKHAFKDSDIPTYFSEHYIRVWGSKVNGHMASKSQAPSTRS